VKSATNGFFGFALKRQENLVDFLIRNIRVAIMRLKKTFKTALLLAPMLLTSCAAPALRNQFRNYNEAYADSLNQQMLLNLARLENGHPAYYLAIGVIDNKYTFSSQTSAGASGSYADSRTTTRNTPIVNGSPSAIASFPGRVFSTLLTSIIGYNLNETVTAVSNPEFQFIPINNEASARQVLQPISTEVFLALYQQGYPVDQLLRIMIERIETPLQDGQRLVLVNSPTRGTSVGYARFLRTCAILRELQKHGYLALESNSGKELLGKVSFAKAGTPADAAQIYSSPTLGDYADAEAQGYLFTNSVTAGWQIYRKHSVPRFVLKSESYQTAPTTATVDNGHSPAINAFANKAIEFLKSTDREGDRITQFGTDDFEAITNVILGLSSGIMIQTTVGTGGTDTRLMLRSFNRSMEAVASEQAGFDALIKHDPEFAKTVPLLERRPILRMLWRQEDLGTNRLATPLETIRYADKEYQITDVKTSPLKPDMSWNCDVFRLLVALGSQVTVDISKFQRQVLELSQ